MSTADAVESARSHEVVDSQSMLSEPSGGITRMSAHRILVAIAATMLVSSAAGPQVPATDRGTMLPTGVRLDPAGPMLDVGQMPVALVVAPGQERGVLFLSGWRDQGAEVVDRRSGAVVQRLPQEGAFLGLAFSPDGRTLYASGGQEDAVRVRQRRCRRRSRCPAEPAAHAPRRSAPRGASRRRDAERARPLAGRPPAPGRRSRQQRGRGVRAVGARGGQPRRADARPSERKTEDPATGSAAGPLAALLAARGHLRQRTTSVVAQGDEMGRPSRIEVQVTGDRVRVGGACVIVAKGAMTL